MKTSTSRGRITSAGACAAAFLLAQLTYILLAPVLDAWNLQANDRLYKIRAARRSTENALHPRIAAVVIDQSSLDALDSRRPAREWYAQTVRALANVGVSVQAWDIVFDGRRDEGDLDLVEAVRSAPGVVLAMFFGSYDAKGDLPPPDPAVGAVFPEVDPWPARLSGQRSSIARGDAARWSFDPLRSAANHGHINVSADLDGTIRRLPLVVRSGDRLTPSLVLASVCRFLDVPGERVHIRPGRRITLEEARLPDETERRDIHIPIDRRGRALVDLILPWELIKKFRVVEIVEDVHDYPDIWREKFDGKIVVVGDVTQASNDIGVVPTDPGYPLVGIHIGMIDSILRGTILRGLTTTEAVAAELLLALCICFAAWRLGSISFFAVAAAAAIAWTAVFGAAFVYAGIAGNFVRPILFLAFSAVGVLGQRYLGEAKERARLRSTFESYFPPTVVEKLMGSSSQVIDAHEKKVLTVLFSDIVGFTQATAERDPLEIQASLSEYFDAMVEIVFRHGGTVDKFIGDGMLVFFGDPVPQSDHAARCVRAAAEMQTKAREIDRSWKERGWMPLRIRVGIHTGSMVVGNMGSARRLTYTVLGPAVNLAARLETSAPPGAILISKSTRDAIGTAVETKPSGEIEAKGFDDPIAVWLVVDGNDARG